MPRKLKITEMDRLSPEGYRDSMKTPIYPVLDNVRSLHNVGSIFRTSDALRLEKILLCGITGTPPHAELHKTALGAEEVIPWSYYPETTAAVLELKNNGVLVLALEQAEGSIDIRDLGQLPEGSIRDRKVALVVGNEVDGVSQEVINLCDYVVEIPQRGTKHSMNVSVAGGIALWEISQILTGEEPQS